MPRVRVMTPREAREHADVRGTGRCAWWDVEGMPLDLVLRGSDSYHFRLVRAIARRRRRRG